MKAVKSKSKLKIALSLFLVVISVFSCLITAVYAVSDKPISDKITEPKVKSIYNLANGVCVTWEKSSKAQGYLVYRRENPSQKWSIVGNLNGSASNKYTDTTAKHSTLYYYTVAAVEKTKKSPYGKSFKSFKYIAPPAVKSTEVVSSGVKLTWEKKEKVDGYLICKKVPGGDYTQVAKVKGGSVTSYTDKNTGSGTFIYCVRAYSGEYRSNYGKAGSKVTVTAPVKGVSVKNSPSGVTVKWSKMSNATVYEIYRMYQGGKWQKAGQTDKSKTSFIDKKVTYGKKASYKVRAGYGKNAFTPYSVTVSLYTVDPKKPMVALTFDDGPYSPVTNQILDCLKANNSRATFFVAGSRVSTYKDCIKREVSLGCEVGNHTYNHTILTKASASTIKNEISKTTSVIEKYAGKNTVKLVRAPGGAVNSTVKANVAYPLINWSVDTMDWSHRTTSKTVANIKSNVRNGSIVLMHDLYTATGNAAVQIIPWLKKQGYQLVTISEMADAKGIVLKKGSLYNSCIV